MRFMYLISCILLCTYIIICFCEDKEKMKFAESHRSKKIRKRKVADHEKIINAIPYHRIHVKLHGNDLKKYKTWPELESKNSFQLRHLCRRYLICVGIKTKANVGNATMDLKELRYNILEEEYVHRSVHISQIGNAVKTRPVCMLKCRLNGTTRTFRFVEGSEEYSAFLVEPSNKAQMVFIIVDACQIAVFNQIPLEQMDSDKNMYEKRRKYFPSKEEIQQATQYQTIHAKIYGNNLEAYKVWPELEEKNASELDSLCYKYVKCINHQHFYEKQGQSLLEIKLLKYYRVDEKSQQTENVSYQYCRDKRWVKMLRCQSYKNKTFRFIKASDEYSVFETKSTSTRYDLFTITDACKTDVLNKIEDFGQFNPSLKNENMVTSVESFELKEGLIKDLAVPTNYENETDDTSQQITTKEYESDNCCNPAAVESIEANAQDLQHKDKAIDRNQSDEEISTVELNSENDSELTITDDDMYTKYSESD